MSEPVFSADELQALEQKVLRAVELVKREREARATAEAEIIRLREELSVQKEEADSQRSAFLRERDAVRQRIEAMLAQIDDLL